MIHVSAHAISRYRERVCDCSKAEARRRILLHTPAIEKALAKAAARYVGDVRTVARMAHEMGFPCDVTTSAVLAWDDLARRSPERVTEYLRGVYPAFPDPPPFDRTPVDPGYIKGYIPGVRENGGQYSHAGVWALMAQAHVERGDLAELTRAEGAHPDE